MLLLPSMSVVLVHGGDGCTQISTTTFASFYCECNSGNLLGTDGFSCNSM